MSARILVVPPTPGALVDPEAQARAPDEIDEAIDEIFGPDPGGAPGWLDLALLAGGLGLILWAQLGLHSSWVTVVGAVLVALGSILPVRSAWRAVVAGRAERRRRGLVLNLGHPLTRELAAVYDELLLATQLPDTPFRSESVGAAHGAVVETAVLLDGGTPATPADEAYVEKRVRATRELTRALNEQRAALRQSTDEERALERTARSRAGEELDALGMTSLTELDDLTRLLDANRPAP